MLTGGQSFPAASLQPAAPQGAQTGIPGMPNMSPGGMTGAGHPLSGPASAAMPYYDEIMKQSHGIYDPYISRGQAAGDVMGGQFGRMSQDPTSMINDIMGKYQSSPGFQLKQKEALRAAGNTAAAGGMRGSLSDISQQAGLTDRLMGQDMQQWLQNALGVQKTGLAGEQGLYQTGFGGSRALGGDISQALSQQGQLAFGSEQQRLAEEAQKSGMAQSIGSGLGFAAGTIMGGPVGGMAGAAAGGAIGGMF